jgi:hypothetical protein
MQNQPVMGVEFEFVVNKFKQPLFYLQYIFAGCNAGAITDPEYVRINRNGRMSECRVQDNVGCLSANSR